MSVRQNRRRGRRRCNRVETNPLQPTHCLAPARARRPVDAPLAPSRYARMFPELPSFSSDEAFLFALGRAGGLCDCRTEEDDDSRNSKNGRRHRSDVMTWSHGSWNVAETEMTRVP